METKTLTIEESNKLIAEFMGATYTVDDYGDYGYKFEKPVFGEWHTMFQASALKYHTSWDWIMSVVEKIESIGMKVNIFTDRCDVRGWYEYAPNSTARYEAFNHSSNKIDATYQAVTDFIQWYNINSLNQQQP